MQILLTKTNSLLSYAIRWFIKDKGIKYSEVPGHAAIRFGGMESNWMIQSHRTGVEPYWWPVFKEKNQIVAAYEVKDAKDEEILTLILEDFIRQVYGKGYDFTAIVGFIWGQVKRKFSGKKQKHNLLAVKNRYFCSELVIRILQYYEKKIGKQIIEDVDASAASPLDLMRILEKSPFFKRIV